MQWRSFVNLALGFTVALSVTGYITTQGEMAGLREQVNALKQAPKATLTAATSTTPNPLVLTCMPNESEPFKMFDGYGAPIVTGGCYGNAMTAWGANMAVMTKVFGTGITVSPWTPRQAARIEKDRSILSCVSGNNDWVAPGRYGPLWYHCAGGHWVH